LVSLYSTKQKSVTQVKLEANERGVEMMLVNYCNCLKIRYPERHDKNKYFCIKEHFEEEWEAAWLFQFIPDYFSCLPFTTSLSVISLLSAAARPSFLSLFYTACKRTSIFVLLSVPSSCSSTFSPVVSSSHQSSPWWRLGTALLSVVQSEWDSRVNWGAGHPLDLSDPAVYFLSTNSHNQRPRSVLGYSNQHEVALSWKLLSSAM